MVNIRIQGNAPEFKGEKYQGSREYIMIQRKNIRGSRYEKHQG